VHRRTGWLLAIATLVGMAGATTASAAQPPGDMDRRGVREAVTPARAALDARLGLLTGPSNARPEDVALGYVRDHRDAFGLDDQDISHLELVARAVSPDGITHLRYNQVLDGIRSYDSGLSAHVTRDGRLIAVSGAPLPGAALDATAPKLSAGAGLGAARAAAGGSVQAPAVDATARGRATFATGESAQLLWAATKDGPRLTWSVQVDGAEGDLYRVQVDAADGTPLVRTALTDDLGKARYYVKDPDFAPAVQTTMPAAWFDDNDSGARLWGNLARTYVDPNDQDPAAGSEIGGTRVQIPATAASDGGPDWLYGVTTFPGATPCPASGCTWDSATPSTATTNRAQAAVNAHVLVSRFHDHLAQPPIGFDEASGNFQRVNAGAAGAAGDYVQVEIDDGQGLNNANFSTPSDGSAPRMQMFLFTTRDANGADVADVVYHEYGHGLSNRLVVNASGGSVLSPGGVSQGAMMGEAWSDFYALDLLNAEGSVSDTAAPAEVTTGGYLVGPGGIRSKPIDCPVDPGGIAGCNLNGTATSILGGYTYADIANTNNTSPHNGSEVWAETLWDLRAAVGRTAALALVTGGMRLSPAFPTMLDMRDAILRQAVAMRSAPGAADDHYATAWQVFAARGMGAGATTTGSASTTPAEAFDAPSGLRAGTATVTDPYPGGDADGLFEPGETVAIAQPLTGIGLVDLAGVTGTLSTGAPGAAIVDGTAAWPLLGRGRTASNADALTVKLPATSCDTPVALSLAATSGEGGAASAITVDTRPSDRAVVAIPDNQTVTTTFRAYGAGAISDVDLRIDELRHTFVGDLVIKVSHDGVTATAFDPADDFAADDLVDLVLDDEAASALPTTGSGPITGRRRPSVPGALAAFDGHPAAGVWTLSITDIATDDAGQLRRWGLDGPQVGCSPLEIPAADTADAADVTAEGATARGSVTPNGRATGLRFAYGTTTAYGSATATQDAGAGGAAVAGTAALGGLAPSTTYHVRAEAIRENGVVAVAGPDRTFTTAPAPARTGPPSTPPGGPPAVVPPTVDKVPPAFSTRPKVTLAKAKKGKRAATATFALSEAATVRATLTRRAAGVKSGSKCVKKTAKRRKGKACALFVPTGRPVSKAFTTTTGLKLALGSLKKGTYVVTLTATDKAGNRAAKPATVTFTVR
jgi:hypothetical protein